MKCTICKDMGLYKSRRCLEEICAHRERVVLEWKVVTVTSQDGESTHDKQIPARMGGRIMTCPTRTCACEAGKSYKLSPRQTTPEVVG